MTAREPGEVSPTPAPAEDAPGGESVWSPSWNVGGRPIDAFAAATHEAGPARERHEPFRVPAMPFRLLFLLSGTVAFVLIAWQTVRVIDGSPWSGSLAVGALAWSVVAAASLLIWTWVVVENARRLLAIARSQEPPSPVNAAFSWVPPLLIAGAAGGALGLLQSQLSDDGAGTASPLPLAVALGSLVATLLAAYRPLYVLSNVTRRIGGRSIELVRWFWAPVVLLITGAGSLWAFDAAGLYGDDFEGLVPAWALGVVAVPPALLVLAVAARGGAVVEEAVASAFARRNGEVSAGVGLGRVSLMARALRADARPPIHRDVRTRIRLVPGTEALRMAVVVTIAALALLSIMGAIVMFLFWRESNDGILLQSQQDRAWDALAALQGVERLVAMGLLAVVALWSFVNVMNARLSTGRRRNPLLAAAAWPAAAYGIWWLADRNTGESSAAAVVTGFALQAMVLFVPFFLLERAAVAVSARRQPIRAAYALAVILLIHTQGLVGLSTVDDGVGTDQFGRVAGYLALAALIQLISTLTITEASQVIDAGAANEANRHNFLAEQRRAVDSRAREAAERRSKATAATEAAAVSRPSAAASPPPPPPSPTTIAASSPPPTNW